jgi:hypothetical protein
MGHSAASHRNEAHPRVILALRLSRRNRGCRQERDPGRWGPDRRYSEDNEDWANQRTDCQTFNQSHRALHRARCLQLRLSGLRVGSDRSGPIPENAGTSHNRLRLATGTGKAPADFISGAAHSQSDRGDCNRRKSQPAGGLSSVARPLEYRQMFVDADHFRAFFRRSTRIKWKDRRAGRRFRPALASGWRRPHARITNADWCRGPHVADGRLQTNTVLNSNATTHGLKPLTHCFGRHSRCCQNSAILWPVGTSERCGRIHPFDHTFRCAATQRPEQIRVQSCVSLSLHYAKG